MQVPDELRPTRKDLIRRHLALESDLNEHCRRGSGHCDWGPTLTHAASTHAQMAYALRIEGRKEIL